MSADDFYVADEPPERIQRVRDRPPDFVTGRVCRVEFFGGPGNGRIISWYGDRAPPFRLRFPIPLPLPSLSLDEVLTPLVAEYERCSASSGAAYAYVFRGTRAL